MAAINYGTVAVVPKGVWDSATQYNVANLVTYDGSSYLAHTKPPVGTLPTDASYWQVSAQGTNKATADAVGVVKPDGETIAVDAAGTISAKKATESTFGIVSGGTGGVIVSSDGVMSVDTTFSQATDLANIIAAEAFSTVLGKISKAIATTMNLDENALLKSMLSSVDVNDATKIPTSAYIHQLVERIGMGTDLDVGTNLTEAVNQQNSDLAAINSGSAWQAYTGFSKYSGSIFTISSASIYKTAKMGYIIIEYSINSLTTDHVNLLTNIPTGFSTWQTQHLTTFVTSGTPQTARLAIAGSDLIAVASGAIGTYRTTLMYPLA